MKHNVHTNFVKNTFLLLKTIFILLAWSRILSPKIYCFIILKHILKFANKCSWCFTRPILAKWYKSVYCIYTDQRPCRKCTWDVVFLLINCSVCQERIEWRKCAVHSIGLLTSAPWFYILLSIVINVIGNFLCVWQLWNIMQF